MRVLVVDDDDMLRMQIVRHVRELGHEVLIARNGLIASQHLKTHEIDAVITDVQMPSRSGIWLLQFVSADVETPPPFFVHSSQELFQERGDKHERYLPDIIPEAFEFAIFKKKIRGDVQFKDIEQFLGNLEQ